MFFILNVKLFGRYIWFISKNIFSPFLVIVLKSYFISLDRQTRTMRVLLDVMFLLANSTQQKYVQFFFFRFFFRVVGEVFFYSNHLMFFNTLQLHSQLCCDVNILLISFKFYRNCSLDKKNTYGMDWWMGA